MAAADKDAQSLKMLMQDGFVAALDQSGGSTPKALQAYGVMPGEYSGEKEMMDKMHEMRARIMSSAPFSGDRVIAAILFEVTMDYSVGGKPTCQYLWEEKRVVPILKVDKGLSDEKEGVQLMKDFPGLEALLDKGIAKGVWGTKMRSVVRHANEAGVQAIVRQQFDWAKQICAKGLVPILEPEVDIHSPSKAEAEEMLAAALLEGIERLPPEEKVIFKLTPPTVANIYKPLDEHPNCVRVVALSGGYAAEEANKLLAQNSCMVASYSRALVEGLTAQMGTADFEQVLNKNIEGAYLASKMTPREAQLRKMAKQPGFVAALDQSGGSTPKALQAYGVMPSEYSGEKEMMDKMHEMRARVMTSPSFGGDRVLAAILFEATMNSSVGDKPTAQYLWEDKQVVPILKVDKGLAEEVDGVQLMRDFPGLDELLDQAVSKGIWGTKMRSVIRHANSAGIQALVRQQLDWAGRICAKGLVPILEPEVDILSPSKARAEKLLLAALFDGLASLAPGEKVMLKLTIPSRENLYQPLLAHHRLLRLLALSGGYDCATASGLLARNAGMIASFSRALLEGLKAQQSAEDFRAQLERNVDSAFQASRT